MDSNTAIEIIQLAPSQSGLVTDLFDQYRVFYKQPSDTSSAAQFIETRLQSNESVIFLARDRDTGESAAFTQLYPLYSSVRMSKNWLLNDLYVAEKYRKQGIGEMLIRRVFEFARSQGARFVDLSTAVDNYTAQRLYESIGFEKQQPDNEFLSYRFTLNG